MSPENRLKKMGFKAHVMIEGVRVNETDKPRPWPVFVEVSVASFGSYDFVRATINSFLLMKQLGYEAIEADACKVGCRHVLWCNIKKKEGK